MCFLLIDIPNPQMSIKTRVCYFLAYVKAQLCELNLFNSEIEDVEKTKNEKRSTRIYLILLITSIVILAFYYCTTPFVQTNIIQSPSFSEYSSLLQYSTLKCSCSKISVKYQEFLQITPFYHELCQSDFVSDEWIDHLFTLYEQSWNNSIQTDFHRIGVFQFQTLRLLCQRVRDTIKDNLQSLNSTELIESELISEKMFKSIIHSHILDFIDLTPKAFIRTLQFIQNTAAQSLLMTGASVTSVLPPVQYSYTDFSIPYPGIKYTFSDGSTCVCSSPTATTCMGIASFQNDMVLGFQTGCYMFSALLKSTLQAFYNQTFTDSVTNTSRILKTLNSSNATSTTEVLLNRMFVTHWINTTSYEKYFNSCAPDICQYTIIEYYSLLNIVVLLIGLFGGLSSALRIIAPFIINYIWPILLKLINKRRKRPRQSEQMENTTSKYSLFMLIYITVYFYLAISVRNRLIVLLKSIKKLIITLNLFNKVPPSQNEQVLQQERHTTRLYLVLLLIFLSILILFTSIRSQTISVTIELPSLITFNQLYTDYSSTLSCPCNQTTIKYNECISDLRPQYHEIYTSQFVTSEWININFIEPTGQEIQETEFRFHSQFIFQLLSTLCHMANQTVKESLQLFYRNEFFTSEVLSQKSFETETSLILTQIKRILEEEFQSIVQLIKSNFKMNKLITAMNSAFYINNDQVQISIPYFSKWNDYLVCGKDQYPPCECFPLSTNDCYQNMRLYNYTSSWSDYTVSGLFRAWSPFESLLISTFECFYNQECLTEIVKYINTNVSKSNFTVLKSSVSSQSKTQYGAIEILSSNLFIQSWNENISYLSYFNQCHPLKCQYTNESRLVIIYIITTVFGLIGGLNIVLRLITPIIVKFLSKLWNYIIRHRRNVRVTMAESTSVQSSKI